MINLSERDKPQSPLIFSNLKSFPLYGKLNTSPEQRVLVALSYLEGSAGGSTITALSNFTGMQFSNVSAYLDKLIGAEMVVRNEQNTREFCLTELGRQPAKYLYYALAGRGEEVRLEDKWRRPFGPPEFKRKLNEIMNLIIKKLPSVQHPRCLNIEQDECFKEGKHIDHWFYCHGISTRLQEKLGADKVKTWVDLCNKNGIGEVVINERKFADEQEWEKPRVEMQKLESHEYWLVREPERPVGYIAFGDMVALIFWDKSSGWLYQDKDLARVFRNNVLAMRVAGILLGFCCEDHKEEALDGRKIDIKTPFYRELWTGYEK